MIQIHVYFIYKCEFKEGIRLPNGIPVTKGAGVTKWNDAVTVINAVFVMYNGMPEYDTAKLSVSKTPSSFCHI